VFTLLVFAVAIWLSPNRRRTALRAALGVVLAMALVLTGFNLGRSTYLDAIENAGRDRDAAAAVYDQVLGLLRVGLRTVLVLGLVIAVGLWLAGPGRIATRIRGHVTGLVRSRSEGESTRVGRFVATNRTPLRVLVVGGGLLVLVVLSHPGPVGVLVTAGLVVVGLLIVEFLGRTARSITH
jgi:hypothetical protein